MTLLTSFAPRTDSMGNAATETSEHNALSGIVAPSQDEAVDDSNEQHAATNAIDDGLNSYPDTNIFASTIGASSTSSETTSLYKTLPTSSIRLLEILPFDQTAVGSTAQVSCKVSSHLMGGCPPYVALSYTWGRPPDDCEIMLNGQLKTIRRNLWRFLQEARSVANKKYKWLWIDALCINQNDARERGHQVGLMPQIYRNAQSVLIWLGPSYGSSDAAMRGLIRHAKRRSQNDDVLNLPDSDVSIQISLLCKRPYWTRLWIFQEVVLARDIILMCGSKIAPWQPFRTMLVIPSAPRNEAAVQHKIASDSAAASIVRKADARSQNMDLFQLMIDTQDLCCSEPRDRVFALLGTVTSGHKGILPDYEQPLPVLLNSVLRNYHIDIARPHDLNQVNDQCLRLDGLFGSAADDSIYRMHSIMQVGVTQDLMSRYPLKAIGSSVSLWWALTYNHAAIIDLLKADSLTDLSGWLNIAIEDGCTAVTKLLLDNDVHLKLVHNKSYTETLRHLVTEAAGNGYDEIVELLLVSDRSSDIWLPIPLTTASQGGHVRAVQLLLDKNFRAVQRLLDETPGMQGAVSRTKLPMPGKYLFPHFYSQPLYAACQGGHSDVVKLLLNAGASVNHHTRDGEAPADHTTALYIAVHEGHLNAVTVLLRFGASVYAGQCENQSHSALLNAAVQRGDSRILSLLLPAFDTDPSAKARAVQSAFSLAVELGYRRAVELLLEHGAVIDAKTLEEAAMWKISDPVELLIMKRAEPASWKRKLRKNLELDR